MMSSTMSKDANDGLGRCHCVEKNLMDPAEAHVWKVWDGSSFKEQGSITVTHLPLGMQSIRLRNSVTMAFAL